VGENEAKEKEEKEEEEEEPKGCKKSRRWE
jgi:hypothetical protein